MNRALSRAANQRQQQVSRWEQQRVNRWEEQVNRWERHVNLGQQQRQQQHINFTHYLNLVNNVAHDLTDAEFAAWMEWGREVMGVGVGMAPDGTMVRAPEVATGLGEGRMLLEVMREWGRVLERREESGEDEWDEEWEGDEEMWVWVDGGSVDGEWGTVVGEWGTVVGEGGWDWPEEEDEEEDEKEEEWTGYNEWAAARFRSGMGIRYRDFVLWRGRDAMRQDIEVARREREDAGGRGIPTPNRRVLERRETHANRVNRDRLTRSQYSTYIL